MVFELTGFVSPLTVITTQSHSQYDNISPTYINSHSHPRIQVLPYSTGSLLENNWLLQLNAFLKTQEAKIRIYYRAFQVTLKPAWRHTTQLLILTCSREDLRTSFAPHPIQKTSQWPYASSVVTRIHFTHCLKFGNTLRKHLWCMDICPSMLVEGNWFLWSFQSHMITEEAY